MDDKQKDTDPITESNDHSGENLNESAAARRIRLMMEKEGKTPDSEITKDEPKVRMGLLKSVENFWYHNKTITICIFVALIIAVVGIWQLVTRVTPDIYIMYAGPKYEAATNRLMEVFASNMKKDYNGDGKNIVNILTAFSYTKEQIAFLEEEAKKEGTEEYNFNYASNVEETERFQNELIAGESIIMLLDREQYENNTKSGIFMTLDEALGAYPDEGYDDCAITFKELKFAKYYKGVFASLPDDVVLVIRKQTAMQALKWNKAKVAHENHLDFFKTIVNFEYPAGYEEK